MSWIDHLLIRLANFLFRKRMKAGKPNPLYFVLTGVRGDPYMFRYYLLRIPWLNFKIHLHHIVRSDEDQDLHDHPWNFVSLVLWEGYIEELPEGRARRVRAGEMVRHRGTDAHRLTLIRPAWTLCFVTGKKRVWGFHKWDGWVDYKSYFDDKFGRGRYYAH